MGDYKSWANGLKAAGYATNPQYAEQLIKIIEDYSLYQFDNIDSKTQTNKTIVSTITKTASDTINNTVQSDNYDFSISRTTYTNNKVKYIISGVNDSYEELSKEYGLFKKEILKFNDLDFDVELKPGTVVYLEKKKKRFYGTDKTYTLTNEDTIYSVSQKFGIRLKNLLKLNSITEDKLPKIGQTIKLK